MMSEGLPRVGRRPVYVVLDDDPTGVQTLAGIHVLLAWTGGDVLAALGTVPPFTWSQTRAHWPPNVHERSPRPRHGPRSPMRPTHTVVLRGR